MSNKKEKRLNEWLAKQDRFALIRTSRNYQRGNIWATLNKVA